MQRLINLVLVVVSTVVGFVAINASFPFVFHQSIFPRSLVRLAGSLQYTMYPDTYDRNKLESWVAVVGDSYAAGMGDAFLDGDRQYSIAHFLREDTGQNYLIFAQSAFGSINAARQLVLGVRLMNDGIFYPGLKPPAEILVFFYEGNDLDDNLRDLKGVGDSRKAIRDFVRNELSRGPALASLVGSEFPFAKLMYSLVDPPPDAPELAKSNRLILHGQELVVAPLQSAAVELSDSDIARALAALDDSLEYLHDWWPDSKIRVVYIPSVVTSYDWHQPVEIQSYQSEAVIHTLPEDNLRHSELIRSEIEAIALRRNLDFIDTTDAVTALAKTEILHGPRDWKHMNSRGYELIAKVIATHRRSAGGP
jgi:hypothetical protein